uniref:Aminotransferase-like plant mobile domain-containing protein n=1 Tax=Fagus sylvatica TaxID=28930 RepID=A0A2N9G5M8_FAGSY
MTKLVTLLTKPSIKVPDRVRLYMALVLSYFLFPTTSQKVTTNLLPLLDDRANLGRYAWGKAVYEFLVSGLNRAAASKQAKKAKGNLHIQGCTALLQIWACEHLGIGQKNAEINQPFPRFLAWTHQKNVILRRQWRPLVTVPIVLIHIVQFAGAVRACSNAMGARVQCGRRSHGDLARNPWQLAPNHIKGMMGLDQAIELKRRPINCKLELQAERAEREALARHVRRLENELHHVKGLVATPPPSQSQLPIQTPIVDLPSSPSKAVKRGKAAKKKAKVAMVDLASSPSKRDNAGEAAVAMVDLVSSPSKGATSVRYTRAKTRAHKNLMIVAPQSEPVRNEWVDAHFLYQPTADDEAVLTDFRKKWGGATRRATRRRPSEVDSNEVAISTETYEITGRDVSSLLGDQAQDDSSRWISTAVVDTFKDVLMEKLTESGHPPPYINFIISVHGGTMILGFGSVNFWTKRQKNKKGEKLWSKICIEKLGHKDVHTWLLEYKNDIPNQDKYA